jgi:hypothetical protein
MLIFPPHDATVPSGSGTPHYRGYTTTLKHTTARRRDLYLTTHNIHNRQIPMPPAGYEPTIPAIERTQTHALDGQTTAIV